MRDSTIFYRSFYEAIKELPSEDQALVYDAIFSYALDFKEKDLKGICKTVFTLIKPQLDANNKRFMNGKEPKTKQTESKTEAKQKQKPSKRKANNNVNNNVNKNVNENNKENENNNEKEFTGKPDPNLNFQLKEVFCTFYSEKFKTEYIWFAKDWAKTKLISENLLLKIKEKTPNILPEQETEQIVSGFKHLLKGITDPWILSNLSMSIVDSKFNEIINQIINKPNNGKQKGNNDEFIKAIYDEYNASKSK